MQLLTLPNLTNTPNTNIVYPIGNKSYTFQFKWCGDFCLLSIYIIRGNNNIYLIKGQPITINSDLIARVKDDDLITGSLLFMNKYNISIEPTQDNFHTDYYLIYLPLDEILE